MNTSNMIPISYVKNITPLVVGDELYNKMEDVAFIIDGGCDQVSNLNEYIPSSVFFLKSFADRPNTGKQPVDEFCVVDYSYHRGNEDLWTSTIKASQIAWSEIATVKSWKPNHPAMLSDYKKTQEPKEQRCGKDHPLSVADPDLYMRNDAGEFFAISERDNFSDKLFDKPVFTQAMVDAGKLPPVGMRAMFHVNEAGVDEWFTGFVCGEFMGMAVARLDDNEVDGYFDAYSVKQCKPIDSRTEEDKTREVVCGEIIDAGLAKCTGVNDVIDLMFNSDKFTITLNKVGE